uniref:Uncharacterized protein n=1 Tax=Lepeophtheirus salmonis TaxID=72036 RepID=A0A0K2VI66_LEPSM
MIPIGMLSFMFRSSFILKCTTYFSLFINSKFLYPLLTYISHSLLFNAFIRNYNHIKTLYGQMHSKFIIFEHV